MLLTDAWSGAGLGRHQQHKPVHLQPLLGDSTACWDAERRDKKTVSSSLSNIRALKNIVASGGRCDILTSALEKHKSTVNLSRILCRKTVLIFCGGHSLTLNAAHLTEFQMHHEKMRLKKTTHPQVKVICQQCICVCIRHL